MVGPCPRSVNEKLSDASKIALEEGIDATVRKSLGLVHRGVSLGPVRERGKRLDAYTRSEHDDGPRRGAPTDRFSINEQKTYASCLEDQPPKPGLVLLAIASVKGFMLEKGLVALASNNK
jgi:hypothetical protein